MKILKNERNEVILQLDGKLILFSYKTPVALLNRKTGDLIICDPPEKTPENINKFNLNISKKTRWSKTTQRHISNFKDNYFYPGEKQFLDNLEYSYFQEQILKIEGLV